jgi:hypothetical protein
VTANEPERPLTPRQVAEQLQQDLDEPHPNPGLDSEDEDDEAPTASTESAPERPEPNA